MNDTEVEDNSSEDDSDKDDNKTGDDDSKLPDNIKDMVMKAMEEGKDVTDPAGMR